MKDLRLTPFAPILVESTRSIGYSFEAALADIIDNSISKAAKEINVNFRFRGEPYIAIVDDGIGMNEEELVAAMRYGTKSSLEIRDRDDLGRFGLGLKMASLSQCRKLTVITKKNGKINAARWDLDHIINRKDWYLLRLEDDEIYELQHIDILKAQKSGTIVIWENFDRLLNESSQPQKVFDEKIEMARLHVGLVFHRFLDFAKAIKINFNNHKVASIDPFLKNNPATQPLQEQEIIVDGSIIKVKPFVLPYASKLSANDKRIMEDVDLKTTQGFYVYRNKRLIVWGTWFRLLKQYELNKLARVRVDIPNTLDSIWDIDIKKSTASLPDIVKKSLVDIVENTVGRSESVFKYRGRNINNDTLIHIWNTVDDRGNIQYEINRDLPLYKALTASLDQKARNSFEALLKIIETSFPFEDIYYRFAKHSNKEHPKLEFKEVYGVAIEMIESIKKTDGDVQQFIKKIDKYDYFLNYPDVIKAIREEYENE